jgi:VanZ family protein
MSDASEVLLWRGWSPALSAWLPVLLWALVIVGMSTDGFGASNTIVWVGHLLRLVWPGIPDELVVVANAITRKVAHPTEYAIFAVLLVRALRSGTGPMPRSPLAVAIGVATALALADEANQSLSTARTGALLDCVLDVAGACVGALIVRSR